jgi:alkanesulfonate monooxygenase SsuD/methylene tetrahydromethanopterin reductase-like flavin-dependent oxidoreductase (luciferase family)
VFVQAFAVGGGDVDGVAVRPADVLGCVDAVGLVDVPGSAQPARIDVAAAMARSPGVVDRIGVIRAVSGKGAEPRSRRTQDDKPNSRGQSMKFGVVLPGGTATQQLEQAIVAEDSGWDGVFVWEAAYGVDAWTLLAAIAMRTTRVMLGTVLTPLPWRRPWKVASQVVTLDQLSAGRAILTVGLGAISTDLPLTGEVIDLPVRADHLDEGIDLIRTLWEGGTSYHGRHYHYQSDRTDLAEVGHPVQERIPIWVVGVWPRAKSMRRVLRCDGVVPQIEIAGRAGSPEDVRDMRAWLAERGREEIDVVIDGETPTGDRAAAAAQVLPWADAGATWWLETRWEMPHHGDQRMLEIRERLTSGPPSV